MPTKFKDLKQGLLSGDPVVPSSNQSVVDQQRRLKDDKLARQQSHFIDEQIKKEHAEILQLRKTQRKILLVGQTASDKTALLKQFLLQRPLTQFNLDRARIYLNVLNSVQHILYVVALPDNNIVFHSPRYLRRQSVPNQDYPPHIAALATRLQPLLDIQNPLERYLQRLTNISTPYLPLRTQSSTKLKEITMDWNSKTDPGQLFVSCADVLVALWDDPTVQDALAKQPQSIRDSLPFFMDDLARIASRGYLPSLNDTLKLQRRPWGVQEYSFWFGAHPSSGLEWKIFDVGGAGIPSLQQAKYFQDVNAIVFLAPVDVFDQTLDEHPTVNCLKQTFLLWKEICSRSLLHNVAILLLMYKCDVLKAKLESGVQFCNYLAGYEGPNEPAAVTHHLEEKLTQLHNHVGSPQRPLYRYAMSGIDSSMVNAIIAMVQDRFLQQEMITLNLI